MERKTRKVLNMYQALHPRSNVGRLYLPRSEGGKGLLSLEECINDEKRSLGQYLKMNGAVRGQSSWLLPHLPAAELEGGCLQGV